MSVLADVTNTPEAWSARAGAETPWEAAGWSRNGQQTRFGVVASHLLHDLERDDTVLDFGCGTGAFSTYVPSWAVYYGFDWADGMLARAAADHPQESFLNDIGDATFDHVVAIGPFNLPGSFAETIETVGRLWEQTRKSLIVSLYRGTDERCLSYEPFRVSLIAESLGINTYLLDASYLANDVALVCRR